MMNANSIATAIAALEPLYSDNYINELIDRRVKSYGGNAKVAARRVAYTMRDDYEVKIARLERELADLRALQADSAATPQPVSEWVPVEHDDDSDTLNDVITERIDYFIDIDDGKAYIVTWSGDRMTHGAMPLPDDIRLCKRAAAPQPVTMPVANNVVEAIESLRALVVAYVAMQVGKPTSADEKYMNDARIVREWLDELQRRPQQ